MNEIADLFNDPMPRITRDSNIWPLLFRKIYDMNFDKKKAVELHKLLWTMRSMGTYIRSTHLDTKLMPLLLTEGGYWEDQQEFDDMKIHLLPYTAEIKKLFQGLNQGDVVA